MKKDPYKHKERYEKMAEIKRFKYTINYKLIVINQMLTDKKTSGKIIVRLLKDFSSEHTITSLSKELKVSRVGIWKALKELESDGLIVLNSVGSGKTSTYLVKLNWKNDLLERTLSLILAKESNEQQRWKFNFSELEKHVDFIILYGSILHSPEKANDIDIVIVSNKKQFLKIDDIIKEKQLKQAKKIHDISFTQKEFKHELQKPNKAFIEAVRKGVVLFGQEEFIKFIKELKT